MHRKSGFNPTFVNIVTNAHSLYMFNLVSYFHHVLSARNLRASCHNGWRAIRVVEECYKALYYYNDLGLPLSGDDARNLLIAAMFQYHNHEKVHTTEYHRVNIATSALRDAVIESDKPSLSDIIELIALTERPYKVDSDIISRSAQILRDADNAQMLGDNWLETEVFGRAKELSMPPIIVLQQFMTALTRLEFYSDWGQKTFPEFVIGKRIVEVDGYLTSGTFG